VILQKTSKYTKEFRGLERYHVPCRSSPRELRAIFLRYVFLGYEPTRRDFFKKTAACGAVGIGGSLGTSTGPCGEFCDYR